MTSARVTGLLVVILMFSMTSCSRSAPLTLDTSVASARSAALVADGQIQGEVANGHACFWITTPDGATVSLVWPEGSTARDNPLRVEDDRGRIIAAVGDDPSRLSGHPSDEPGCATESTRFILGPIESEG